MYFAYCLAFSVKLQKVLNQNTTCVYVSLASATGDARGKI